MLTQEYLRTVLQYNPDTGLFIRLRESKRYKPGEVAGCHRKQDGYIVIRLDGALYLAHRLAWFYVFGEWPGILDHINGVRTDNKISNLRPASKGENAYNSKRPRNNTSGVRGVSWHAQSSKWRARTKFNGKNIFLGLFDSKEAAGDAYRKFCLEHHGEFAKSS